MLQVCMRILESCISIYMMDTEGLADIRDENLVSIVDWARSEQIQYEA